MLFPQDLIFVDAARYAAIARNFLESGTYTTPFNFFPTTPPSFWGWPLDTPYLNILFTVLSFRFFGVNDFAVIIPSIFFFVLSVPLVFFLAKRLFGKQVALFSSLFFVFTSQLLNYAGDGGSETFFIFELLLIAYLLVLNKRWSLLLAGIVCGLAFFTKLQSFLFVPIFLVWASLLYRKHLSYTGAFLLGLVLVIFLNKVGILLGFFHLSFPAYLAFQQTNLFPGDSLSRSGKAAEISILFIFQNIKQVFTKIFYNLFNFYKSIFVFDNLLPHWASPVIVVSFALSQINFFKDEVAEKRAFRVVVLLMVIGSFLLAAATSPHIRYAHFALPFVIILAVDFICNLLKNYKISQRQINLILTGILLVFLVLPIFGATILDSRFTGKNYNVGKPHAQKVLGQKLGEFTGRDDIVVTNLDTWGSWYGVRKTIMMPTNFTVLEDLDKTSRMAAIFLTDFQRDNGDHPLAGEWGEMFEDPQNVRNEFIVENFEVINVATISAQEVYENKPFTYKLWQRRN